MALHKGTNLTLGEAIEEGRSVELNKGNGLTLAKLSTKAVVETAQSERTNKTSGPISKGLAKNSPFFGRYRGTTGMLGTRTTLVCFVVFFLGGHLSGRLYAPLPSSSIVGLSEEVRTNQNDQATPRSETRKLRQLDSAPSLELCQQRRRQQEKDPQTASEAISDEKDEGEEQQRNGINNITKENENTKENEKHDADHYIGSNSASTTTTTTITSERPRSPMCEMLSNYGSPSTMWVDNLHRIHRASRLPKDGNYSAHDLTAELLQLITPRLPSSIKTVERDAESIGVLLKKVYERYRYILQQQQQDDPVESSTAITRRLTKGSKSGKLPPPPVKILVLGGSVARGRSCVVYGAPHISEPACSWPNRLEQFVNSLVGGGGSAHKLVDVYNGAREATNSNVGDIILRYKLFPSNVRNPDVIISAYSTNDQSTRNRGYDSLAMKERLFRTAIAYGGRTRSDEDDNNSGSGINKHSKQPLFMNFDDWVGGGREPHIRTLMEDSNHVDMLSRYYGTTSMSFADAVRDLVYGDTHEYFFSSKDWYKSGRGDIKQQIHPGQGMHIVSSWIVAYNVLNLAATYCDHESWHRFDLERNMKYDPDNTPGRMPKLKSELGSRGRPRPRPEGLPPRLTAELTLGDISRKWRQGTGKSEYSASNDSGRSTTSSSSCPFSWWFGVYRSDPEERAAEAMAAFSPYVTSYGGWKPIDDHQKFGWVTTNIGRELVLVFNVDEFGGQQINSVVMFILKSYGNDWETSTASIKLSTRSSSANSSWTNLTQQEQYGFHDRKTSEVYVEHINLPHPITNGTSLRFSASLVKGRKFKIMGLLVC